MIETYLLEYLEAFSRLGTLSAASEELLVSQPALTRSMQKLEQELGVKLFKREKNRILLNENGKLAAKYAAKLIADNQEMIDAIQKFDLSTRTINLGSCAPVPITQLTESLHTLYPEMTITTTLCNDEDLEKGFGEGKYQLFIFHEDKKDANTSSILCQTEKLYIAVPPAHPLASFKSISFKDLESIPILLYKHIGFWYDIVTKEIPNNHFLMQDNAESFSEIANESSLPTFITDYFIKNDNLPEYRKFIPIKDDSATVTYYLTCHKKDRAFFDPIFQYMKG